MKLTRFLYDALVRWEHDWEMEPEEYPFEVTDEDDYKTLDKKAEAWGSEHGLEEIEDKIVDYDLEKSYAVKRMVFKFDGHYYAFNYYDSIYWDDFDDLDTELKEVFPVTKTITVYE